MKDVCFMKAVQVVYVPKYLCLVPYWGWKAIDSERQLRLVYLKWTQTKDFYLMKVLNPLYRIVPS